MARDTSAGARVLIVEDDLQGRALLSHFLSSHGYRVREASTGTEAIEKAPSCDVVLIDVGLPDIDGWHVAEVIHRDLPDLPILFVTGRTGMVDKLRGFQLGAEDFVVKPFDLAELAARLQVVARRFQPRSLLRFGPLALDLTDRTALWHEERLDLTHLEYELLAFLATHPNRAWSREELLQRVWANQVDVTERTVDVRVRLIRKALGDDAITPRYIETVRGRGYRWVHTPTTT
jgi:DNA-binding response OmpR family regulator